MKIRLLFFLLVCVFTINAQQYAFWSQYRGNQFMINPAAAGTSKTLDVRASYRYQWTGFAGGPRTYGISLHSRFYKGKLGLGAYVNQDKLGPSKFTNAALAAAFHLKFPDTELSFGLNGSYSNQRLDPSLITIHNSQDQAIFNIQSMPKDNIFNMAAGIKFYNDRFFISASAQNMLGTSYEFFPKKIKGKKYGYMTTVLHYLVGVGYIWSGDSRFAWENNLYASVVPGTPILVDYTLRCHIQEQFFIGAGYRIKTAFTFHLGYTFKDLGQIAYSYDYNTNRLRSFNYGTHEIKLAYVFDNSNKSKHHFNKRFLKQKFQYLL